MYVCMCAVVMYVMYDEGVLCILGMLCSLCINDPYACMLCMYVWPYVWDVCMYVVYVCYVCVECMYVCCICMFCRCVRCMVTCR